MRACGHGTSGIFWSLPLLVTTLAWTVDGYVKGSSASDEAQKTVQKVTVERRGQNTTVPAPIVASVSQYWEGNDGPWSSFAIQVGKKAQNVRILPSTASSTTWVVYEEGCPKDAPANCQDSRGGTFNPNNSLTWVPNSIYQLGVEENLEFSVFGDFGFDTVTLGWQGSGGPTVEHSIVAGIADTAFSWMGVLGLNPRPTNFSGIPNSPQVSFVQALKNQNSIPSLSWSYTAGAQYRLNKIFGSLILGGYDTARFAKPSGVSPNLTFPFYTDIARDLLVGISSITTSNTTTSASETKLLQDGIFAFIDSTVPHFWLPQSVCEAFEAAFGLTWNSTSELYTLNSSQHSTLSKLNPTVTLTLSPELPTSAGKSVAISLPYSAFDLNISWPHVESSTYYFPLKRAANDTQYTLGRAFLQEAYIIADFERQNFSVWPCKWDSNTNNANVVAILSTNSTSNTPNSSGGNGSSSKKGLGTGAIAGIAVGAVAALAIVGAAAWLYIKRARAKPRTSFELEGRLHDPNSLPPYHPEKGTPPEELDSRSRHELTGHNNKFGILEAPEGAAKFEMEDTGTPHEADGRERNPERAFEMDAQEDAGLGPKIVLVPATAVSPGPDSFFPDVLRRKSSE